MYQKTEYRWGIQTKLSLASGLLVLVSLASFGLFSFFITKNTLDEQMGESLTSHAEMAASTLRSQASALRKASELRDTPGIGETQRSRLQEKLVIARDAAGLDNVILIGADNKVLVDANGELEEQYPILEADEAELESAWDGIARAAVLYEGKDGRFYKAAYAPLVTTGDREVIAVLRVEASAGFLNTINNVGLVILLSALIVTAMAALLGMLIARSIVVPIKKLVTASQKIAGGDLDTTVLIKSRDEIGLFARTFNQMARNLKKLYEEVEERSRQIVEMSASVAHEVRSPISVIQGNTELLEEDMDDDDPRLDYTSVIKSEIKILNSKITDFLHFARPLKIEPTPIDITEVLDSSLVSMDKEATDSNISIVTNLGSDLPEVSGDFEQLRSLFVNLIRNSIQAMEGGGGLVVSASLVNGDPESVESQSDVEHAARLLAVEVKIEDTGSGMKPEDLERAFDPFFTTKGSGTGLGLTIVKKILDAHNGSIRMESYVGRGTTVRVFLPVGRSTSL